MATMAIILPRRDAEKHSTNPLARWQRFLGSSALPLATRARQRGHEVAIVDEYVLPEGEETASLIRKQFGAVGPAVLGFSCPSAYCADRTRYLAATLAPRFPRSLLVVGGQHFAGLWAGRFRQFIPELSALVSGEGEHAIVHILDLLTHGVGPDRWDASSMPGNVWWAAEPHNVVRGTRTAEVLPLDQVAAPNFALYPSAQTLFPSIEFSRNCRHACAFCANAPANRRQCRRVTDAGLSTALEALAQHFPQRPLGFYMASPNFSVTEAEAESLAAVFRAAPAEFHWRADIRADEISPQSMPILRRCGLAYLDFGLESASKTMLRIMRKTSNPADYLACAEALLAAATACGVRVKVNYLIHPGDTPETVAESRDWLLRHRGTISGISSSVAIEFPGTHVSTHFADYATQFGTRRRNHELSRWGVHNLDPSNRLTYEEAEALSLGIAQDVQTRHAFAESKVFGYVPTDWNLEHVLDHLPAANARTPYR